MSAYQSASPSTLHTAASTTVGVTAVGTASVAASVGPSSGSPASSPVHASRLATQVPVGSHAGVAPAQPNPSAHSTQRKSRQTRRSGSVHASVSATHSAARTVRVYAPVAGGPGSFALSTITATWPFAGAISSPCSRPKV